jgi:diadenosine tetraphosphate (Ap4A) HIT family hydrolase
VILNSKSFFKNENCEIYEYQHYNQVKITENTNCPFCDPDSERELIVESATAYAIYDKFPVNNGHALIIPKRHCSDYFELTFKEQAACMFMLNKVKEIVSEKFNPDGFNIGINIGEKAGQTVNHVHIHLIPRYDGYVEEPSGGVTDRGRLGKVTAHPVWMAYYVACVRPITGLSETEILWDLPLSRGYAYMHAALAREGVEMRFSGDPDDEDEIFKRAKAMMRPRKELTGG